MSFLWEDDVTSPQFPPLTRDAAADVLVIGGGMAGVLCAYTLKERGIKCLLVEAATLGSGITRGTTAVLSAQHDTLYSDLVRSFGAEKAKEYLDANLKAVAQFRRMSEHISCNFENRPSVMYSLEDRELMKLEADTVQALGYPAEFLSKTELPLEIAGAVRYPDMAQFHPLKFLYGAADGLNIHEHTFVRSVEDGIAFTDDGRIRAKSIIVATHFPFINRRGLYFLKLFQMRSFVLALENVPLPQNTYVQNSGDGMYFRPYGNLLLVGGGDHRTGYKKGGFNAVREFVRRYYPDGKEKYAWATQDCMSLDGVPYIGKYSPATPGLYVATGFNEWGMTSSMAAAQILADMIEGKKNPNASVFSPQRSMLQPQLFKNLGATLCDFAIPTVRRCSHLGCALRWNRAEHTWDCPCHGSRYDRRGKLIDNPAMHDTRI